MNKKEALNQLKSLHYLLEHFQEIESKEEDVKALEYAINELERTAQEVPVQEHYVTLKIDSKEIDKVVIDEIRKQQKHYNITLIPV